MHEKLNQMSSGSLVNVESNHKLNKEHVNVDTWENNDHFRTGFARWKPDFRTSFADLTKEMLFEGGKQHYFRWTWETMRSTQKTLDLNSTELNCMLQTSLLHYQFFVIWMNENLYGQELIFLRLAEWRVCFECSSGDQHAFICISSSGVSQWSHFNGLQQHFNPSKPVKAADLIKYCQWCMGFILNKQKCFVESAHSQVSQEPEEVAFTHFSTATQNHCCIIYYPANFSF